MNKYSEARKVAAPVFLATRLLDQIRERVIYLHYSLQTEKTYLYWARFFIRWHGRTGMMRHPREMGQTDVEAFLTMLANERQVSPATHRQTLNALLFLYKQVLGHSDVSTTMIYTHVLKVAASDTASPLDALRALAV
jgi:integrase